MSDRVVLIDSSTYKTGVFNSSFDLCRILSAVTDMVNFNSKIINEK
jgi:hypothetical protein